MNTLCPTCVYYCYDEDYEEYVCDCQMDEDDYYRIMQWEEYGGIKVL